MSQITSHVLDTAKGCPAEGIPLTLYRVSQAGSEVVGEDITNADGRSTHLLSDETVLEEGMYLLHFSLVEYLRDSGAFYPYADITFNVAEGGEHYHIPLLLSPFGYSTYRGS